MSDETTGQPTADAAAPITDTATNDTAPVETAPVAADTAPQVGPAPTLADRVAALEDFFHKLATATTADIATLKADITAEATKAEGVLAHFEGWLKNLAAQGVREVEHLFGADKSADASNETDSAA